MNEFNIWSKKKESINDSIISPYVNIRDIWFTYIGKNIGYEKSGGVYFLRPFIVIQIFPNRTFLGIPLTTQEKDQRISVEFFFRNKTQWALIQQLRLFDTKRVKNKIGKINKTLHISILQKQEAYLLPGSLRTNSNTLS